MKAIHQLTAGFAKGDAISNEALVIRGIFRKWGCESRIFSETKRVLPELRREVGDISEYAAACRPDDIVLLHLSIGSIVNDVFASLPCKKAILYHNITPSHYFRGFQEQVALNLKRGREQAKALARNASVIMAVSRYNACELETMGFERVNILPLLLDFEQWEMAPDRRLSKQLQDGKINILFVGRCAPNKKIEDLLTAFAFFQHSVEPDSRLIHVGSYAGLERYHALLMTLARNLQLNNLFWAGSVSQEALNACYRSAHVFLCMSEHEGFCIPLIESMAFDVPVLAYAAAAVPETLDKSGVLFREKRFDLIAELMGRVIRDETLKQAILVKQRERLRRYRERDLEREIRTYLSPILT